MHVLQQGNSGHKVYTQWQHSERMLPATLWLYKDYRPKTTTQVKCLTKT